MKKTRTDVLFRIAAALVFAVTAAIAASAAEPPDFHGKIGDTWRDSTPDFPREATPPAGAPNVVLIVIDDGGFAHLGAYGGPTPTPNIDALAASGLRYTQFHVNPVCSPTRAALLTGRNAHAVGMGAVAEVAIGYPGYNARIPESAATVAKVLGDAGYNTLAVGKWHLTPYDVWSEAGPFDHWPLGLGFRRFYGYLGGRNDHFVPLLWEDNHRVPAPQRDGYYLTEDLTDHAIEMVRDHVQVATGRPFFLYLAFGAVHSPHQAPPVWRDRVRGKFDEGWDVWRQRVFEREQKLGIVPPGTELPPRNTAVPAWTALDDDQRKLALAFQESFAAMLEDADAQIGRLLGELDRLGVRKNTLVILLSDNGASRAGGRDGLTVVDRYRNGIRQSAAEMMKEHDLIGGPLSDPDYPMGWAMVANTPFKNFKGEPDSGGTQVPLIVSWPGHLPQGELRTQFHHAVDIAPTLYEITGVPEPKVVDGVEQSPLAGVSMAYTFDHPEAATRRRVQYWEQSGQRGIWRDGWLAVDLHRRGQPWSDQGWELYDTRADFSLAHDRAAERPDLARDLVAAWWTEARANQVLPLDDRGFDKTLTDRPKASEASTRYVFRPGASPIPAVAAPATTGRTHVVTARVEIPKGGAEGVLACFGSRFGGWSLYLHDRRLVYSHNYLRLEETKLVSDREVPVGKVTLTFRFTPTGEGVGRGELLIDGRPAGALDGIKTARLGYMGDEGLQIGRNDGSPVSSEYQSPYAFTGTLEDVVLEVPDESR